MNSTSVVCREAAATTIVALQSSLQNETLLFSMLPGLSAAQRNLVTYLIEAPGGSRKGAAPTAGQATRDDPAGRDVLIKEMRRFSTKM